MENNLLESEKSKNELEKIDRKIIEWKIICWKVRKVRMNLRKLIESGGKVKNNDDELKQ
ncbi:hypothetical protein Glove_212g19 [Diversispora epigaea]|uniref:Uncharacterized protein n=1 Tax=Diversispora epigaea TaxID=1348612 RepID=A0A397IIG1_9GLOM|nr:hypothetical protein Glove_212g19 [Diversispora epigaea]